ncbi:AAA family ATPase [Scopulibacillus cellulosilyticus]|uniref:AAA family ATPase n=1 Tax=Scopulibacillus cellulosilyticus TaxID=2665665 RepID=A0ABW2PT28_9BACL
MNDQAELLRKRMTCIEQPEAKAIAVVNGKGGVGKSVFTVNFSIALGSFGKKVLIIDLDNGRGNIEYLLGIKAKSNFLEIIKGSLPIHECVVQGPKQVSYVSGDGGFSELFHLDTKSLDTFLNQLDQLKSRYDFIIFNIGAGTSQGILSFIQAAHEIILVTNPEPTALADAYSILKLATLKDKNLPVSCVLNEVNNKREGQQAWLKLSTVSKRFLNKDIECLVTISRDKAVIRSVKEQHPCILSQTSTIFAREIMTAAKQYLRCQKEKPVTSYRTFLTRLKKLIELG